MSCMPNFAADDRHRKYCRRARLHGHRHWQEQQPTEAKFNEAKPARIRKLQEPVAMQSIRVRFLDRFGECRREACQRHKICGNEKDHVAHTVLPMQREYFTIATVSASICRRSRQSYFYPMSRLIIGQGDLSVGLLDAIDVYARWPGSRLILRDGYVVKRFAITIDNLAVWP